MTKNGKVTTMRKAPPPLTALEQAFVEVYVDCGDADQAALACGMPAQNGQVLLGRPGIKRALEVSIGFRPSNEMDTQALLEEILTVSRDAARGESYMAALTGYRLFHTIREGIPKDEEAEPTAADFDELSLRAKRAEELQPAAKRLR